MGRIAVHFVEDVETARRRFEWWETMYPQLWEWLNDEGSQAIYSYSDRSVWLKRVERC